MYNPFCTLVLIMECGSIWGRFRAPPVADAARNKEWRNKEYREVNNKRDDYVATGRARLSGRRFFSQEKTSNSKFNIYFGVWLSLVERFVRDEEVGCSNHLTPTKKEQIASVICSFLLLKNVGR